MATLNLTIPDQHTGRAFTGLAYAGGFADNWIDVSGNLISGHPTLGQASRARVINLIKEDVLQYERRQEKIKFNQTIVTKQGQLTGIAI